MSSPHRSDSAAGGCAIVLTPPGPSAIAVVRLSGDGVPDFIQKFFSRPAPVGRPVHGELRSSGRVIDDPLVCRISETAVDLSLHGNAAIVRAVLTLASDAGFAVPNAADVLPDAAYDGDSALELEVAAALPLARTERGWRSLLAQLAAWAAVQRLRADLRATEARRMLNDPTMQRLLSPASVALVGLPNAGKSTLANVLIGVDRHITADRPGTTRDWVGTASEVMGFPIVLIDTPGVRVTTDEIEAKAIKLAQPIVAAADIVVLVLDATRADDPAQLALIDRYANAMRVSNKSDLAAPLPDAMPVSAATGAGIDRAREAISEAINNQPSPLAAYCWTPRQRTIAERMLNKF